MESITLKYKVSLEAGSSREYPREIRVVTEGASREELLQLIARSQSVTVAQQGRDRTKLKKDKDLSEFDEVSYKDFLGGKVQGPSKFDLAKQVADLVTDGVITEDQGLAIAKAQGLESMYTRILTG